MSDHSVASTDHSHYSDCDWVPEYYPFALFSLGSPYWKPNSRKKGTLIIKGLLSNLGDMNDSYCRCDRVLGSRKFWKVSKAVETPVTRETQHQVIDLGLG